MSEKLTRQELKEDQFLESIYAASAWAKANVLGTAALALALIAAVVLAVRLGGKSAGPSKGDLEAERALAGARSEFAQSGIEPGITALEAVRSKYPRSRAGKEALYLLGSSYFEAGKFDQSRGAFEDFLKKPLYDDLLIDGATLGIAASYEEAGNRGAAAVEYAKLWNSGRTPATRIQGALAGARCSFAEGKNAEALDLVEKVLAAYPDAPEAEDARFLRDQLRAKATP